MKTIDTSVFEFQTMIEKRYVYVDKTRQIYDLVRQGTNRLYFLARPRRFGKSLLISTLKALFTGKRELFHGLAIEKLWDWDHETYPVLHLDMSNAMAMNVEQVEQKLNVMMEARCAEFDVPYDPALPASGNFLRLLEALPAVCRRRSSEHENESRQNGLGKKRTDAGKYVLLIDEYDAPISGMQDNEVFRAEIPAIRKVLHDFYLVVKSHCSDMRLLFVTGVSKFAKTSISSAFNNPTDISHDERASDLVGYTHEEMELNFHDHIQAFAEDRGISYEQMFSELLSWYDSYQFSPRKLVKVVNPVSVGRALSPHVGKEFDHDGIVESEEAATKRG